MKLKKKWNNSIKIICSLSKVNENTIEYFLKFTKNFFKILIRTYLKVFNGCPLRIHCTASWIHPDTRDQHILIGAEEGIYDLNLNELHETAMDQLYPRRTIWMYVIKDVLMTLSGESNFFIFRFCIYW